MLLNKQNIPEIKASGKILVPDISVFDLPEKVLQFGTGVLLRGLPDYFIDKANRQGIFNGRIVVVKSTSKGDCKDFDDQDSLYTICIRGIQDKKKVEENIICSSISRVLIAQTQWNEILEVAASENLQVIISNTTEVGIQLNEDDIHVFPPISFPGKVLAVLHHRYKKFGGDRNKGLVIVPTELISDNGTQLKEIVKTLAEQNHLDKEFINWLLNCNHFCNTLVDRIVPGKPDHALTVVLEKELGYQDNLGIVSEVYKLWAIEGNEHVKNILSFAIADAGVIITPDITTYKELKLRLLNGTHSLTCAVAFLSGFATVREAVEDGSIADFNTSLMHEIAKAIPHPIAIEEALAFSQQVLDRFRNPHIQHKWLSISLNYTLKLKMRVVPVLMEYFEKVQSVPENIAFGFAAYLLFMRSSENDGQYHGISEGTEYIINDEYAGYFSELWKNHPDKVVEKSLSNGTIWGENLTVLPGFTESVQHHLNVMQAEGMMQAIKKLKDKRILEQ